jgi:hypothetical protein
MKMKSQPKQCMPVSKCKKKEKKIKKRKYNLPNPMGQQKGSAKGKVCSQECILAILFVSSLSQGADMHGTPHTTPAFLLLTF